MIDILNVRFIINATNQSVSQSPCSLSQHNKWINWPDEHISHLSPFYPYFSSFLRYIIVHLITTCRACLHSSQVHLVSTLCLYPAPCIIAPNNRLWLFLTLSLSLSNWIFFLLNYWCSALCPTALSYTRRVRVCVRERDANSFITRFLKWLLSHERRFLFVYRKVRCLNEFVRVKKRPLKFSISSSASASGLQMQLTRKNSSPSRSSTTTWQLLRCCLLNILLQDYSTLLILKITGPLIYNDLYLFDWTWTDTI